jgi:hypothetical protein
MRERWRNEMRRTIRAAIVCGVFLAGLAAVQAEGIFETGRWISGSGIVKTQARSVPSFTAVQLDGVGEVTVSQGLVQSLAIETDDNILPVVTTEVRGSVLYLGIERGTHVRNLTRLEFRITMPVVTGLTIAGSGSIHGGTLLRTDELSLDIRGSGSVDARLDAGKLRASIGGSGSISVEGTAEKLSVLIDGSGGYLGRDLRSADAEVHVNGSGDVTVFASRTLSVDVAGSGSVSYGGGARPTIHTSGSGSVRQF